MGERDLARVVPVGAVLGAVVVAATATGMRRRARGRTAVAEALGLLLGAGPGGVDVSAIRSARCPDCGERHGRPEVDETGTIPRDVALSVAHAGDVSIAAAARAGSVGIDLEELSAALSFGLAAPAGIAPARSDAETLRRWTRVEAVLKSDGRGLRVDPGLVALAEEPPDADGRATRWAATLDGIRHEGADVRLPAPLGDRLVASVAVAR